MQKEYKLLSHTLWLCTYHIVFCPKYRYGVLVGSVEVMVRNELYKLCHQKDAITIEEINIQPDHVHMVITLPPKYAISEIVGWLKGKVAIKVLQEKKELGKQFWGRHFWSRGYCVSTVGLEMDKILKYVKWQQEREQRG